MANLKNVIYLSNEDYETLVSTGTVTIDGETLTYDENNVYITPDKLASTTEDGLMSAADKSKLNNIESGAQVNVQADWNQTDIGADDYIKNKPEVDTDFSLTSTNALQNKVISEKLEYIDYALTHIKYKLFGVTTLSEIDYKVDYATIYPIPETLTDDDGTHRVVYSDTQLKEIEGNSVAFNQFAKPFNISGVWACSSALGTLSNETERSILYTRNNVEQASNVAILIQNTGAGYATTKGHKYFIKAFVTPSDNFKLNSYVGSYAIGKIMTANVKNNYEVIITANNDGYLQFISENGGHLPLGGTVLFEDTQLFDLTTSGIDSITTVNEAKVELLKRGINVDEYNEYNAGEIKNTIIKGVRVRNSKLATVPLNKISVVDLGTLDWQTADISTNRSYCALSGAKLFNNDIIANIYCARFISDTYTRVGGNSSALETISLGTLGGKAFLYIKTSLINSSTDTTAKIQQALSGIYLFYERTEPQETISQEVVNEFMTKTIAIPQTKLPSAGSAHDTIKVVEGNIVAGQQRYNMVHVSRGDSVDLGALDWVYVGTSYNAYAQLPNGKKVSSSVLSNMLCSNYKVYKEDDITAQTKGISFANVLIIKDSSLDGKTAEEIKTAMNGVILNYEKAEQTETTLATDLTFEEVSAIIEQGGSIETVFEIVPPNLKTAFVVNKVIVS